jgi:hypothetical protein
MSRTEVQSAADTLRRADDACRRMRSNSRGSGPTATHGSTGAVPDDPGVALDDDGEDEGKDHGKAEIAQQLEGLLLLSSYWR